MVFTSTLMTMVMMAVVVVVIMMVMMVAVRPATLSGAWSSSLSCLIITYTDQAVAVAALELIGYWH